MIIWTIPLLLGDATIALNVEDSLARAKPRFASADKDDADDAARQLKGSTGLQGHLLPDVPNALELNSAIARTFPGSKIILQTFPLLNELPMKPNEIH